MKNSDLYDLIEESGYFIANTEFITRNFLLTCLLEKNLSAFCAAITCYSSAEKPKAVRQHLAKAFLHRSTTKAEGRESILARGKQPNSTS